MTDEEDSEEQTVSLGEADPVEGAPLARVASRLSWPRSRSEIADLEGDTVVRTPAGPRTLDELLADVEDTYFQRRGAFVQAIRDVTGRGPIPTSDE